MYILKNVAKQGIDTIMGSAPNSFLLLEKHK